jgi:hypothetical protein
MCSFLLANVITRYELDVTLTPKRWRDLKSAVLRMSEKTAEYGTRSIWLRDRVITRQKREDGRSNPAILAGPRARGIRLPLQRKYCSMVRRRA